MASVDDYITEHMPRFKDELFEFLRIPSISAKSEHRADMSRAAEWLADRMREAGLDVGIEQTDGFPIVLGEYRAAGEDAPTVLLYGHYDVQPPEPLDEWTSGPFAPEVRDGKLFARGAVDDKGQLYLHVKAIEAHMKADGALPVNLVVLAEGEEEVGSAHLMPFVKAHQDRLACDYVVISDTTMVGEGVPTIGTSLRGLTYLEVHVRGPKTDLHSGSYGGAVVNPATALARIIASMHDDDWRATIDGFYDDVEAMADYRKKLEAVPFDHEGFRKDTGTAEVGEAGYSTPERLWIRPTVEVNGLLSGYTGEGAKTVLPARAMAKISFRLVPRQTPDRIAELVEAHIRAVAPEGVEVEVKRLHGGHAWRATLGSELYEAAERALAAAWDRDVVYAGEGGSIPIVPEFEQLLNAPVLLMGFGLPGENAHAPDEWMSVDNFEKGTRAAARLWAELGNG
ncbi:MAG TPA: dipeptidase [Longimicrobiales bacterium]|nr:dipeptidase [Longimicrobiales bacterium]